MAYLQGHHALLIEPHFGRGVPGATQESPKLPGRQRANCGDQTEVRLAKTLHTVSLKRGAHLSFYDPSE